MQTETHEVVDNIDIQQAIQERGFHLKYKTCQHHPSYWDSESTHGIKCTTCLKVQLTNQVLEERHHLAAEVCHPYQILSPLMQLLDINEAMPPTDQMIYLDTLSQTTYKLEQLAEHMITGQHPTCPLVKFPNGDAPEDLFIDAPDTPAATAQTLLQIGRRSEQYLMRRAGHRLLSDPADSLLATRSPDE